MTASRLTPSAEEHIADIVEFIATDSEDADVCVPSRAARPTSSWTTLNTSCGVPA